MSRSARQRAVGRWVGACSGMCWVVCARYLLRARYHSSVCSAWLCPGRVVNISSMMGRMGSPARSPYCITKFGVEAFSDCLRYEMQPQGVMVSIVEPGNFIAGTNLYSPERIKAIADKMWDELPEIVRKDYGRKYFDEQVSKMESYCNSGSRDTSPVIESVAHALTSTTPYTRYHPMDYYWWLRMQIMTHMPAAISDRLYVY